MSTHAIEVVEVNLEAHPNADTLSIVRLFGGFTVCVRTEDWQGRKLGVYIPPDFLVPTDRPEFAFLKEEGKTQLRIKVKKLRGIISQGLLIPAPENVELGQNLIEELGIERYEPPMPMSTGGEVGKGPELYVPKYDLENARRYRHIFEEGEEIWASEKIHGCNGRFVFHNNEMYCGSRTEWKRQDEKIIWWQTLKQNPWIEDWCRENPSLVLFGEVYGMVGGYPYDTNKGQVKFRAFDIMKDGVWFNYRDFQAALPDAQKVPFKYQGPFDWKTLEELSSGNSILGGNIMEGIVIKPIIERTHLETGRVALKLVSNEYLTKG
jgi:RNA ligase (TIGR02306 family)